MFNVTLSFDSMEIAVTAAMAVERRGLHPGPPLSTEREAEIEPKPTVERVKEGMKEGTKLERGIRQ